MSTIVGVILATGPKPVQDKLFNYGNNKTDIKIRRFLRIMPIIDKIIPHKDNDMLHVGEIYEIWTQVTARYDTMELTQYMLDSIHDADFKTIVEAGLNSIIKPQIKKLEDVAKKYSIPLPSKPPVKVNLPDNSGAERDKAIFKLIFDGAQTALNVHVKAIEICTNDSLRSLFINFLEQELDDYNTLIKYGKFKSWIGSPPHYMQQKLTQ